MFFDVDEVGDLISVSSSLKASSVFVSESVPDSTQIEKLRQEQTVASEEAPLEQTVATEEALLEQTVASEEAPLKQTVAPEEALLEQTATREAFLKQTTPTVDSPVQQIVEKYQSLHTLLPQTDSAAMTEGRNTEKPGEVCGNNSSNPSNTRCIQCVNSVEMKRSPKKRCPIPGMTSP